MILFYGGLIVIGAGVGFIAFPTLIDQIQDVVDRGPELVATTEQWLERWNRVTDGRFNDEIVSQLDRLAGISIC